MGKRGKKKKKRLQSDHQRKKGHESGPETTCGDRDYATGSCSPPWNSLDEDGLVDYARNVAAGESGDEVEVAKLLSYLNFSVIPCWPHAQGPPTDVDLLSELTSATHLERDVDGGGEEETGDRRKRRENRKRASRRRPNKRAKKLRSASSAGDYMCLCQFVRAEKLGNVLPASNDVAMNSTSRGCQHCWSSTGPAVTTAKLGRGKTRRRNKGERYNPLADEAGRWSQQSQGKGRGEGGRTRSESTTPVNLPTSAMALQCLVEMECDNTVEVGGVSSDTSATREVDMRAEHEDSDHTPPAVSDVYDAGEEREESDLSDTTTDSGCDGDDEESSVERLGGTAHLPGWWEKEPLFVSSNEDSDSDQEKFTSILNGAFPHMSNASIRDVPRSLKERLKLSSEFKHPGKVGVRASMKKKRSKPSQLSNSNLTPAEVNSKIVRFIENQTEKELKFVMVSRAHCRTITHLAAAYRLQCDVEQQRRRLPVASPRLKKTALTRLATWAEIEPILKTHHSTSHILTFPVSHSHSMEVGSQTGLVGGDVPVLDETNVGNRMLQGMGWRPGMGLGPEGEGMREPIRAYVRPRRSGLGF